MDVNQKHQDKQYFFIHNAIIITKLLNHLKKESQFIYVMYIKVLMNISEQLTQYRIKLIMQGLYLYLVVTVSLIYQYNFVA